MNSRTDHRKFKSINRRELLKLTPVVALGAFAIPRLQKQLLKTGLGFSDWASAKLFRSGHLAPTFADSDLTPFEKFPVNDYDVDDPEIDFDKWTLTVAGAAQKPGDYTLAQIQALPKVTQNTRHRSEEHTSELQSPCNLVCRLLLEKKKNMRGGLDPSRRTRLPRWHATSRTERTAAGAALQRCH